jgi:hypothetical protein
MQAPQTVPGSSARDSRAVSSLPHPAEREFARRIDCADRPGRTRTEPPVIGRGRDVRDRGYPDEHGRSDRY